MKRTDVIVIGAGQAGLAMSRTLTLHGLDHIVLERGRIGERWHSERWKSLRLLTTNAMSALPGLPHRGRDPDAFMAAAEFASYLKSYATRMAAPVVSGVEVIGLRREGTTYRVSTGVGEWRAAAVVIATGACNTPYRPAMAQRLVPSIVQINPSDYREPAQLPEGGVLVVGASATGAQLAEEIHASGRPVTLAVGDHTRLPRRYRGRDIYAWMATVGILDELAAEICHEQTVKRSPSPQLVGRPDHRDLNLEILKGQGVRLVGRLDAIEGNKASFRYDLADTTTDAHARMLRVLERIDSFITVWGFDAAAGGQDARRPFKAAGGGGALDLAHENIRTVVWATGYVRCYPWLHVPVLDRRGEIINRGGVTALAGLYVLGLPFQLRRRSHFIDGCGLDAEDLAPIVKAHVSRMAKHPALRKRVSGLAKVI